MRLSSRLGYSDGFVKAAERAARLEEVGVDVVWVAEAYGVDAVSRLGYLAACTKRVQLGSGILNIYSRTPALLAQTAAGLDELSNGRAILGLGASGPQVIEGFHGVPYDRPVQRTREIIEICRMVWRRDVVAYRGRVFTLPLPREPSTTAHRSAALRSRQTGGESGTDIAEPSTWKGDRRGTGLGKALKILTHPVRERIPIYVASLGDRSVEMAAELAEGWLPIFYVPENADSIWGKALRRGYEKRSEAFGQLEVAAGGALAIGDGLEHLRDLERPHVALYVGGMGARSKNFYNDLFCQYGYEREAAEIQDLYLSGKKREAEALVPADFLKAVSLVGSEGFVKDRISAYKAAGVTLLNVEPIGPDPYGDVARVRELIG